MSSTELDTRHTQMNQYSPCCYVVSTSGGMLSVTSTKYSRSVKEGAVILSGLGMGLLELGKSPQKRWHWSWVLMQDTVRGRRVDKGIVE